MVLVVLVLGLLPAGRLKNLLLGLAVDGTVARSARIHPIVVWRVRAFTVGERAHIGPGNVFRELGRVVVGDDAEVGQFNWLSAAAAYVNDGDNDLAGSLVMEPHSAITSRHYVDCSGGLALRRLALLAGVRSTVLTHSADTRRWIVHGKPVVIGEATLVFSCVLINPGVTVAEHCMVAGGAVVAGDLAVPGKLYGGVPAKVLADISEGEHITRSSLRHSSREDVRSRHREPR